MPAWGLWDFRGEQSQGAAGLSQGQGVEGYEKPDAEQKQPEWIICSEGPRLWSDDSFRKPKRDPGLCFWKPRKPAEAGGMDWGLTDHTLGAQPEGHSSWPLGCPQLLTTAPPTSGALPKVALWGFPGNRFPRKKL